MVIGAVIGGVCGVALCAWLGLPVLPGAVVSAVFVLAVALFASTKQRN